MLQGTMALLLPSTKLIPLSFGFTFTRTRCCDKVAFPYIHALA